MWDTLSPSTFPKWRATFFVIYGRNIQSGQMGRLPPVFNRNRWCSDWKGNQYSNIKLRELLGWKPRVSYSEASKRYFEYCKEMDKKNA